MNDIYNLPKYSYLDDPYNNRNGILDFYDPSELKDIQDSKNLPKSQDFSKYILGINVYPVKNLSGPINTFNHEKKIF